MKNWLNTIFPCYAVIAVAVLILYSIRPLLVNYLGEGLEPNYWQYWARFCLNALLAVAAYVTWRMKRLGLNASLVAGIAGYHFVSVMPRLFTSELYTLAFFGIFLQLGLGLLFLAVAIYQFRLFTARNDLMS